MKWGGGGAAPDESGRLEERQIILTELLQLILVLRIGLAPSLVASASSPDKNANRSQSACSQEHTGHDGVTHQTGDKSGCDQQHQSDHAIAAACLGVIYVGSKRSGLNFMLMSKVLFGHLDNSIGRTGDNFVIFTKMFWMCNRTGKPLLNKSDHLGDDLWGMLPTNNSCHPFCYLGSKRV